MLSIRIKKGDEVAIAVAASVRGTFGIRYSGSKESAGTVAMLS